MTHLSPTTSPPLTHDGGSKEHTTVSSAVVMPQEKNPAFVLQKVKDVSIEERPIPKLESPYDVKVYVKATGYYMTS
jgi:hypothetical protein